MKDTNNSFTSVKIIFLLDNKSKYSHRNPPIFKHINQLLYKSLFKYMHYVLYELKTVFYTHFIYEFPLIPTVNNDYFPTQHYSTENGLCSPRGTNQILYGR
jgi:hypothetical protein